MQTDNKKDAPVYDLGWWPEIIGAAMVAGLITFLIKLSTGIL
ncbi:hypothetical protein [Terasakiella sp. SH-1]|nr:hypothetical protein [Terasakiella sp. SH-1]